jgi:PTS system nitrogen regulatory IIA component
VEVFELLTPDRIFDALKMPSKKKTLLELAERAAKITGLPERTIFDILQEREKLGTTGVGRGIAIPHGKFPGLDGIYGLFVRLESPINFDSVDNQPVDLIFLLLAPEAAGADHLKALARVSRLLRSGTMCEKLRTAENAQEIWKLFASGATSRAA